MCSAFFFLANDTRQGVHVPRDAAMGTAFMLLNTCASSVQVVWQRRLMDAGGGLTLDHSSSDPL